MIHPIPFLVVYLSITVECLPATTLFINLDDAVPKNVPNLFSLFSCLSTTADFLLIYIYFCLNLLVNIRYYRFCDRECEIKLNWTEVLDLQVEYSNTLWPGPSSAEKRQSTCIVVYCGNNTFFQNRFQFNSAFFVSFVLNWKQEKLTWIEFELIPVCVELNLSWI